MSENTNTIKVVIVDRNGETLSYMATEGETILSVLKAPAVVESFEEVPEGSLYNYLNEINGTEVPPVEKIRDLMFRAPVEENDIYVFDVNFVKPEEVYEEMQQAMDTKPAEENNDTQAPEDQPQQEEQPAAGTIVRQNASGARDGVVIAQLDGGMATARIDIICGITTLEDCLMSDIVKARTREDETRLAAYVVLYKGKAYKNAAERSLITVDDGDLVNITPPTLSGKGIVMRAIHLVTKLFKKG